MKRIKQEMSHSLPDWDETGDPFVDKFELLKKKKIL